MTRSDEPLASAVLGLLRSLERPAGSLVVDVAGDTDLRAALIGAGFGCIAVVPPHAAPSGAVESVTGDLRAPGALLDSVARAVGQREVAAIWIGDVLQHITDEGSLLDAARAAADHFGAVPLVVTAGNVTHRDVGAKLLMGRWDVAETGILAAPHRRHFTAASLAATLCRHGWHEVAAADVVRDRSEQHFPSGAAPLEKATSLGAQLAALRAGAGPGAYVTTFVRAYEPGAPSPGAGPVRPAQGEGTEAAPAPFLSVLVRTQGVRGPTLHETLLCLAAQHCDDFEVVVLLHDGRPGSRQALDEMIGEFHPSFSGRVRVVEVSGGGRSRPLNEGARAARGRYLAMLDDDDLVFAHWVQIYRETAERAPGRVVRVGVATQHVSASTGTWDGEDGYEIAGRPRLDFAIDADHLEHVLANRTPTNGYAVPRSLVTDLGVGWDESLPVLEDWDHLLRAMSICGLENVAEIAGLLRWWDSGDDSKRAYPPDAWESTKEAIVGAHDEMPLVLGPGMFSRLRARLLDGDLAQAALGRSIAQVAQLSAELEAARSQLSLETDAHRAALRQVADVLGSTSWRVTGPFRSARRIARELVRARRRGS